MITVLMKLSKSATNIVKERQDIMGLDQYASIQITVPEQQNATFPPELIQALNHKLAKLKPDGEDCADTIEFSDEIIFNSDGALNTTLNPQTDAYSSPLLKIEYRHDDYLARKYWDLNDFILKVNPPKLKPEHQAVIDNPEVNKCQSISDLINGTYDLDITPSIDQIINAIDRDHSEAAFLLTGLKQYQAELQKVLDQYQTNLKAIVAYHIWY